MTKIEIILVIIIIFIINKIADYFIMDRLFKRHVNNHLFNNIIHAIKLTIRNEK